MESRFSEMHLDQAPSGKWAPSITLDSFVTPSSNP